MKVINGCDNQEPMNFFLFFHWSVIIFSQFTFWNHEFFNKNSMIRHYTLTSVSVHTNYHYHFFTQLSWKLINKHTFASHLKHLEKGECILAVYNPACTTFYHLFKIEVDNCQFVEDNISTFFKLMKLYSEIPLSQMCCLAVPLGAGILCWVLAPYNKEKIIGSFLV